ncbi:MAG: hypothetical protein IPH23_12275 [Gammaproteobacteria bacterium]|nr:hypothetical protein [Gammaproteobacteria bacterium]
MLHFAQMATWVMVPVLLEQVVGFERDRHWYPYLITMGAGLQLDGAVHLVAKHGGG